MESIKKFVAINGDGSGDGSGDGDGYGNGNGYGYGSGYGSGDGSGDGYGYDSGYGYGYDSGYGYGYGVKSFDGKDVHLIDGIQTIITAVFGNVAKGFILNSDLTLTPCYVAKQDNTFAHGDTLKDAVSALTDKLFDDMPEDERIDKFLEAHAKKKKYPAKDLFDWHHKLTGSCETGRMAFVKDHEIDLENDTYTVSEFVDLCENSYGGDTIKKLRKRLKGAPERRTP